MIEAKGYLGGRVTFDGKFVEISRSGAAKFTSAGSATKRIPVKNISSVSIKKPGLLSNGYIEFTIPGSQETKSRGYGSQTWDAVHDENSVIFRKPALAQFEALRDAIEEAIAEL